MCVCNFLELVVLIFGLFLWLIQNRNRKAKCLFMSFKNVFIGKDIKVIPYMVYGALWFSKHLNTHFSFLCASYGIPLR